MSDGARELPGEEGWTIDRAERLLNTLTGVLSARVVAKPGGEVQEIHLLTTTEISPKQTVRNVESALVAEFNLAVDHRKISVAQTDREVDEEALDPGRQAEGRVSPLMVGALPGSGEEPRIVFLGHQVESERSQKVRTRVSLEWSGERFTAEAVSADLPRARLESLANATLDAIGTVLRSGRREPYRRELDLNLDGLKVVDAFDRNFVMVVVHASDARSTTSLTGATPVGDHTDRAVILATLQATDRWVRGRVTT